MEQHWNDLWKRHLSGDEPATRILYENLFQQMTLVAWKIVHNVEAARDIAASVWVKLLSMDGRQEIENVRSWCITATKNAALSEYRVERRRREIRQSEQERWIPRGERTDDQMYHDEISSMITKELDSVEHKIWTMHQSGYANKEIAIQMEMSEKTIANRKSMIRSRLMHLLKGYG